MTRHVVPVSILHNLVELALRNRLNVDALFNETGLDPGLVGRPDAMIGIETMDRLFSRAFARVEDPWFGLHTGLGNQYAALDLPGRLIATSATLREAIEVLLRFKDLVVPYLQFEFRVEDELATLACWPDGSAAFAEHRHHNDLVVATMYHLGRSLLAGAFPVRALALRHPAPADAGEYRQVFGEVPRTFSAPRNSLGFSAAVLDTPLAGACPRYHQRLVQLAEQQLERTRTVGFGVQVTALVCERLGEQPVGIDEIARFFNMTARTLQRRLREENLTFGDLRDQVRHETACRLLAQPGIDMDTLAQRLGFSDTANFYHAFRRWEGCTPGGWRRAHAAGNTAD